MQNPSIKPTIFPTRDKEAIPITQSEFATCVSPVRHDQQHLGRFYQGLTQVWYFAIEN